MPWKWLASTLAIRNRLQLVRRSRQHGSIFASKRLFWPAQIPMHLCPVGIVHFDSDALDFNTPESPSFKTSGIDFEGYDVFKSLPRQLFWGSTLGIPPVQLSCTTLHRKND